MATKCACSGTAALPRRVGWLLAAVLAFAPLPTLAQTCHPTGNGTMLTVATDPAHANRSGTTPVDQFATHQGQQFAAARAYSLDMLAALPMAAVTLVLPYDGHAHSFTGPRLEAVLADAGAAGRGVTVLGIDGYHSDFSAAELAALRPVLALCRDGQALGIGDLGPAFVVFAAAPGARPDDATFARMVWGVYVLRPL